MKVVLSCRRRALFTIFDLEPLETLSGETLGGLGSLFGPKLVWKSSFGRLLGALGMLLGRSWAAFGPLLGRCGTLGVVLGSRGALLPPKSKNCYISPLECASIPPGQHSLPEFLSTVEPCQNTEIQKMAAFPPCNVHNKAQTSLPSPTHLRTPQPARRFLRSKLNPPRSASVGVASTLCE